MPESMRKRTDFAYTIQGVPVVRCFVAPTTEGFLFGISNPAIGDVHLTVFFKEGKIRTAIKDSARNPDHVYGRQFTPDILGRRIEIRFRGFVKPYRPNMVAWVMRPWLKRKLTAALDFPVQDGAIRIPWEIVQGDVLVDLRNERRWRRVHIRDLLKMPGEFGFRIEEGKLYLVRPFDVRSMIKVTEGQVEAFTRLLLDYLGFGEYAEYVKTKLREGVPSRAYGASEKGKVPRPKARR